MKINNINRYNNSIHVKKIFHISDIHIRLYSRMDEYIYIFNKLYDYIKLYKKNNKNDYNLIVITGDLFHCKNELSPESIMLALSFLKTLASIYPVILIAGNHDALLNNKQRLDSISAILMAKKIKNLYYFRYSGVYQIYDILFCVNSLLDNFHITYGFIKKSISNLSNYKIIGLYHGPVNEVETDVGYRLRGNKLLKDFIGYDYVLLGDIHKFQYVDKNRRFGYASSLICQNFGETESPHGVLVWDIVDKISYYHNIYNPYAFWKFYYNKVSNKIIFNENTLDLNNNEKFIKTIRALLPDFRGNIKIIFDEDINDNVLKLVQLAFSNASISYNIKIKPINNLTPSEISPLPTIENYWVDLIKKYCQYNKYNFDNDFINTIYNELIKLDNSILSVSQYNHNNSNWKFIYLKFDNLFAYGSNNYINFSKFSDSSYSSSKIIGLFANNSAGKSSLIDIITFMLYGKITRPSNLGVCKDLININETKAYGEIVFQLGETYYKITKKLKKLNKTSNNNILDSSFKISVYYEKLESSSTVDFTNNVKDLTSIHRIKTDKIITKLIGSYDEFIFTSISLQVKDKSFKDLSQKEKKDFLIKILKLDYFSDELVKTISDKYKETKQILDSKKKQLTDIDIDSINLNITEISYILETKKAEKIKIVSRLNYLMKLVTKDNVKLDIISLENKINNNLFEINKLDCKLDYEYSDNKFGVLSTNYNNYIFLKKKNIDDNRIKIIELSLNKKNLNIIDSNYDNIDILIEQTKRILENKIKEYGPINISNFEINDKISEYNHSLDIINNQINNITDKDFRLNLLEKKCEIYNKLFLLYKKYITDDIKSKIISELNKQLEDYMNIKSLQLENVSVVKENKLIDELIDQLYIDINKSINDLNDTENIIEKKVINKFISERTSIVNNRDKIVMINEELLDIVNDKKKKLIINDIDDDYDDKISLAEYNNNLEDINKMIIDLTIKLNNYKDIKILYETLNSDILELTNKYKLYNFLYEFTARDGISLLMLNNWLPVITTKINNIIEPYINKKIHLVLTNELITMISYKSNNFDEVKSLLLYGGMEAFILDIAFKIVLSQLAILPKSNLLIIDEGISVLDKNHIANISFLFNFLKFYYNNVLVISHLHDIKSDIDILLNITSNNKQSRILYN